MWARWIGIAAVVLLVLGAAWALWPRPIEVETAVVGRAELTMVVEEEGITRIREIFRVSAPVAGRLTRVAMHVGDLVGNGETVASIGPSGPGLLDERSRRIAEAAVVAAEAAVSLAEANLAQAEAQNSYATAELARTLALAEQSLVSTKMEERAQLEAATARESVAAARAALVMRRQELESARAALIEGEGGTAVERCCTEVRSPADGHILEVLTESEQVVQAGTPLMDIGDPADLEVVVEVLSSDAVRIVEGAEATLERWGGEPLRAVVKRIDPVAVTQVSALGIEEQRTRVVLDVLDGPEARARLGHGYRVVARIVVWRDNVVSVPMGALFRRGDDWVVFVTENGTARVRTVQLGHRSDAAAEIVAGLAVGDIVIVHPSDALGDGHNVVALTDS